MLTKALAYEYRGRDIRVNAIAPGGVNTAIQGSFAESLPPDADFKMVHKIMSPMGMTEPEEIGQRVRVRGAGRGSLHDRRHHQRRRRSC